MKSQSGFTIIELMITLAIIAVLTVVVYPVYRGIIADIHRNDAIQAMAKIYDREHLYLNDARQHAWETGAGAGGMNIAHQLAGWSCPSKAAGQPAKCENKHFEIRLVLDPIDLPDYSDPTDPNARKRVRWAIVAIPKAGGSNEGKDRFGMMDTGSKPNWAANSAGWDFAAWAKTGSWAN